MTVDRWERRQLCEDGNCIGVIGMDGTCKVCGRPAPDFGDLRKPGRVSSKSEVDDEGDDEEDADGAEDSASPAKIVAAAATAKDGKVSAWNERRLCSDGACVGLIGDDGKCKVCRKTAEGIEDPKGDVVDDDDEDDEEDDDEYEDDEAEAGDDGEDEEDGEEDEDDEHDDDDAEVAQDEEEADDDDKRALCPDGACVGVIGDNGKCKLCGKAAA